MQGKIVKRPNPYDHYATWSTAILKEEVKSLTSQAAALRIEADEADRKRNHVEQLLKDRKATDAASAH